MDTDKINLALEQAKNIDNMKTILVNFQQKLTEFIESMTPEEKKAYSDILWLRIGDETTK